MRLIPLTYRLEGQRRKARHSCLEELLDRGKRARELQQLEIRQERARYLGRVCMQTTQQLLCHDVRARHIERAVSDSARLDGCVPSRHDGTLRDARNESVIDDSERSSKD